MKKSLMATLMVTVFLVSLLGPLLSIQTAGAVTAENPNWYTKVNGQLGNDTYYLYPFNQSTTNIGLSQFGEFIDNTTATGLEYAYNASKGPTSGRDPWAAPTGPTLDMTYLPQSVWINGWFIEITYMTSDLVLHDVWAGALFSDFHDYGKPWHRVAWQYSGGSYNSTADESFLKTGCEINATQPMMIADDVYGTNNHLNPSYNGSIVSSTLENGGRKTNGTAYTEPMQILYDGPRKFVAVCSTYIGDYDRVTGITLPLVKLTFTVIFNKDKKQVVELKDVKILIHSKGTIGALPLTLTGGTCGDPLYALNDSLSIDGGLLCQFSDRQEWDLGTKSATSPATDAYSSYAHYYTDGGEAVAPGTVGYVSNDTEDYELHTAYNAGWTTTQTLPARTIVNGIAVNAWGPEPHKKFGEYDLAQIISNDKKYVAYAAHWPACSDWTIDAKAGPATTDVTWYRAMKADDPHYIDALVKEPWFSPIVIGEWDFILTTSYTNTTGTKTEVSIISDLQFRGVSVYGVTDLHDASDHNFLPYPSGTNIIDSEVWYLLDEVFNPYDLKDALGDTAIASPPSELYARWVDHFIGDGTTKAFQLRYSDVYPDETLTTNWPNVTTDNICQDDWSEYAGFTERVLLGNTLMKPTSSSYNPCAWGTDYFIWNDTLGFAWINFTTAPPEDTVIKILFSTTDYCGYQWLTVGRDSATIDSVGAAMVGFYAGHTSVNGVLDMSAFDMAQPSYPATPSLFAIQKPALPSSSSPWPAYLDYYSTTPTAMWNKGRAGLQDDWSSHTNYDSGLWYNGVPISSANIINVGGPSASLTAQYFNDFDDVFATMPIWTPNPNNYLKIMPVSCWSLNRADGLGASTVHAYMAQWNASGYQTVGYGVISTYLDLNGTIGLNIWGYSGEDTYFTCWSLLHSDVLALAMANMPCGLTTLVLQFNYVNDDGSAKHPTDFCFVQIVEALGTISEYNYNAIFKSKVKDIPSGDYQGDHYWCGHLPYHWFTTPDYDPGSGMLTNSIIEYWGKDSGNWPMTDPDTGAPVPTYWIDLKYPPIHPDP